MKAAAAWFVVVGLGLVLNAASCQPQNACATSDAGAGTGGSGAGTGGGAGSCSTTDTSTADAATTCGQLTALQDCLGAFCKADGAGSPFCTCFMRGYDLSPPGDNSNPGCLCIPFNSAAFCQQAADNGLDGSDLDCSAATASVATQCVGVQ
ncbi:MAG TPA: hypothetical protein VNW92_22775 [Polyangiaceae bacterium]|jgi:hypothetical protein|nr:hypothetical protein [Polyangiaceae bacterium]